MPVVSTAARKEHKANINHQQYESLAPNDSDLIKWQTGFRTKKTLPVATGAHWWKRVLASTAAAVFVLTLKQA